MRQKGLFITLSFLISFMVVSIWSNLVYAADSTGFWIRLDKKTENVADPPLENIQYYPLDNEVKVALVLSGGGARGLSHIGVLKALEEHSLPLDLIVGTSIGSIVGGFYAAGFSADEIAVIAKKIDWNTIFTDESSRTHLFVSQKSIPRRHLLQFRLDGVIPIIPSSISHGQKVFQALYNRLVKASFQAANDFDNLKIPFRAVATDLLSGKKVVLDKGDLAEAINASSAFPLLFAPVEIDSMWLVDGGITDNLPVSVALEQGADIVIAADATSNLRKKGEIDAPWEIADQVTTIMMKEPIEKSRAKADVVIQPNLQGIKGGSFANGDSIIQRGYTKTVDNIDSLKSVLTRAYRKDRGENRYIGIVEKVDFKGLSGNDLEKFSNQLKTVAGQAVYKEEILADLKLFYSSGIFKDVKSSVRGDSSHREVCFYFEMHPFIDSVIVNHTHILSDSMVSDFKNRFSGKRLNVRELLEYTNKLKNILIKQGYSLAQINNIRFDPEENCLIISLDEGYISNIKIAGNEKTLDFVILREFPLKEGNIFEADLATKGIQDIYSTDLFDRVLLNLEKEEEKNILIIKVKEKKYFLTRLGAHYSLERETEAFVELLEDNFFGTDTKVSLFGLVGDFSKRAEALFYTVRLFKTYLTTRVSLYYQEREDRFYQNLEREDDYRTTRRGARFSIGQQIGRLGLISAELRIENVDISSANLTFPFQDSYRLRTFTIRSVVDKRDNLPFPKRGIF
ncbi:BamA/TamA family outer membrane protein, partial [Candidatus Saccharibacteria bacterium]|nr:BamA/TamA family outer membrane protein [Candidatus Saccharibacteria bacterium]